MNITISTTVLSFVAAASGALLVQHEATEPTQEVRAKQFILVDDDGKDAVRINMSAGLLTLRAADDAGTGPVLTYDPKLANIVMRYGGYTTSVGPNLAAFTKRESADTTSRVESQLLLRPHRILLEAGGEQGLAGPQTYVDLSSEDGAEIRLLDRKGRDSILLHGGARSAPKGMSFAGPHVSMFDESNARLVVSYSKSEGGHRVKTYDANRNEVASFGAGQKDKD